MTTQLTWMNYSILISLFVSVYYLIISLRFYPNEMMSLWKKGFRLPRFAFNHSAKSWVPSKPSWINIALFEEVEKMGNVLKAIIQNGQKIKISKTDLLKKISELLKNSVAVQGTPFQFAINNLIATEMEKHGFIHLNASEQEEIWQEV